MLKNRPDVREAELQIQAAKCDLQAARAAFYPSINISANIGFQAFNPKLLFSTPASLAYALGAGLLAPLVNRSAIEAQFDAAKATQIEAMYNYQKVLVTAYVEVVNSLTSLHSRFDIVAFKKDQKAALEQTVEMADMLYRAGKASYVEVLIAQQNTLAAQLELIEAMRDGHLASIVVYKALGGGWQ
jgi:outer membrane protein TolC